MEHDFKKIIKDEYSKCFIDPVYFIRKYCWIVHPIQGKVPFNLYNYQEHAIRTFEENPYTICAKARQIGLSATVAAYALWILLFHDNKNILVIATKEKTAKNLIGKVKFAYENLPVWLRMETVEDNKLSLKFKNGSTITATSAAPDSSRSEALSLLIIDEAAFIKTMDEIWTAALPTISTGGHAIIISTPNGMGNFFHRTWQNAITDQEEDGGVRFIPLKFDWSVHPDRDVEWRKKMGKLQGESQARQEHDVDFLASGNTVIDGDIIALFEKKTEPPVSKAGIDNNVWIWKHPDYTRQYVVVADVARGDAKDKSAFHVLDIETCEQVAEYKGKIGTTDFAHLLIQIATTYNDALLVVENSNVGWAVLQIIIDRDYKNLYYTIKDLQILEIEKEVVDPKYYDDTKKVAGFTTSSKTRPLMISKLNTYMCEEDNSLIIHSLRTIEELKTFRWENGKAQAIEGSNDDLVLSLMIGLWVRDMALELYKRGIELVKLGITSYKKTSYDQIYSSTNGKPDPYKIKITNDVTEDLRWLL